MPKLQRWIVASKTVDVLDPETRNRILELGGNLGGGWSQVHQHICVNQENKERIEEILREKGFEISEPCAHTVFHPDYYQAHEHEFVE